MKEINTYESERTELNVLIPVSKQKKISTLFPLRGHRIFELNLATGIINEVKPDDQNVSLVPDIDIRTGLVLGITGQKKNSIKTKDGCIYTTALNSKNADKRFIKILKKHIKK